MEAHTLVISFSSPKPRARLLQGLRVYTVRKKRRKQFIGIPEGHSIPDWANEGRTKPKIADVVIQEVSEIETSQLMGYVAWSGFGSTAEWVEEIKRLNRWKDVRITDKFWLYLVEEMNSFFKAGRLM